MGVKETKLLVFLLTNGNKSDISLHSRKAIEQLEERYGHYNMRLC